MLQENDLSKGEKMKHDGKKVRQRGKSERKNHKEG